MRALRVAVTSRDGAAEAAAEIDAEIKRIKRGKTAIDRRSAPAFIHHLTILAPWHQTEISADVAGSPKAPGIVDCGL